MFAIPAALQTVDGLDLNVLVVMPEAYAHKRIPAEIIASEATEVFRGPEALLAHNASTGFRENRCQVMLMEGAFIDVLAETRQIAGDCGWQMLEQHTDASSVQGHHSTALELLHAIPNLTDVVCSTGTGATAAGLRKFLPPSVTVHSRPAESGTIDGLSNVRRYNNFCDAGQLANYDACLFDKDTAETHTAELFEYGIEAGPSSGACFWLAREVMADHAARGRTPGLDAHIAFICADGVLAPAPPARSLSRASRDPSRKGAMPWTLNPQAPHAFAQQGHHGQHGHQQTHGGGLVRGVVGNKSGAVMGARSFSTTAAAAAPETADCVVVGGGPVGGCASWFLAENEVAQEEGTKIICVHDPKNRGAHEDWSRLARLSFDGPLDEMNLSRHAIGLLDLIDEVRMMNSGAPVVPVRPGMVFLASPGTDLARACANGEAEFGDDQFRRVDWRELESIYPGNAFDLPADTLAWTHPTGYCVSPLELADAARKTAEAYGVETVEGRARVDHVGDGLLRVTLDDGREIDTRKCFLFAGAVSKQLIDEAIERDPVGNAVLEVPEFDDTYITAISTVRYGHVNHPAQPAPDSGHVVTPIVLGQLDVPELIDFQANFSIVAEEYGDVLKTRLSGSIGSEVVATVDEMKRIGIDDGGQQDSQMDDIYQRFFGPLFPFLSTEKPLDFNRCVTYRNYNPNFSGTSLVEKQIGEGDNKSSLMTTVGCFGVGVKFGPALGEAAAAHTFGQDLQEGMNVFTSGDPSLIVDEDDADRIDRAW